MPQARNKSNSKLLHKFIIELRKYYHAPGKDLYDPDHLWDCFQIYWGFLYNYANPALTECIPEQWAVYEMSIKEPESADWRTRRGGKSMALSIIGVFFALIQFGHYEGFVIYRAPYSNQLKQFHKWLRQNPFVLKIRRNYNEVDVMDSVCMDVAPMSESQTASLGASVYLLDEEKKIEKDTVMYDLAIESRGMNIEGPPREKRIIHKSTGGALTMWEDIIEMLEAVQTKTQRKCISIIDWTMCPWISWESIEKEQELNYNAPWYIDQEYRCLNVPRKGHFFEQSHLKILGKDGVPLDLFEKMKLQPNYGGVDFNGKIVGHLLLVGYYDGVDLYLFNEITFQSIQDLHEWMVVHPGI